MVAEELADGRLIHLDFHEPWMQTTYGLFWRADRTPSPAAVAFVEELRAVESEIGAVSSAPGAAAPPSPGRAQRQAGRLRSTRRGRR